MMLGEAIGLVAPYYNLVLVSIVIIMFIIFLRNPPKRIYIMPWRYLFAALCVYIVEEILTVLNDAQIITLSKLVAPVLEMIMISLFIYMLFLQQEYLKKHE